MTPTWIECGLLDDVRDLVCRDRYAVRESSSAGSVGEIDLDAVDDAAAGERAAHACWRGCRASGNNHGRIFDRYAERDWAEVLHRAELPLAEIVEADDVARLDRVRDVLPARRDPESILSRQRPRLPREKVKSRGSVVIGEPSLAQARRPTVGLGVIRRGGRPAADAQEVRFEIAREFLDRVDVTLEQELELALASRSMKFVFVVER